jgi:hypothetical protein
LSSKWSKTGKLKRQTLKSANEEMNFRGETFKESFSELRRIGLDKPKVLRRDRKRTKGFWQQEI